MSAQATPPAWMFSFIDLAFLLLIAMTQLAADAGRAPDLGEIIVPRIDASAVEDLPRAANHAWQLRIHPPVNSSAEEPARPFELVRGPPGDLPERIDAIFLAERLAQLSATGTVKPLLAPHEDSRSRDLLDAIALLEGHWPTANRRRAIVTKVAAR